MKVPLWWIAAATEKTNLLGARRIQLILPSRLSGAAFLFGQGALDASHGGDAARECALRGCRFSVLADEKPGLAPVGMHGEKKYRAHLVEVRSLFAITSPSVHSLQRPENINNLYPVVTSGGKQAGNHSQRLVAFSGAEAGH